MSPAAPLLAALAPRWRVPGRQPSTSGLTLAICAALLAVALVVGPALAARAAQAAPAPLPPRSLDAAMAEVEIAARGEDFVGLAVVVVEGGMVSRVATHGVLTKGQDLPVEADTVFRFASLSKAFTTTLISQLAEEGRLDWADPAVLHAPQFRLSDPVATGAVTLEHLASHRSGLKYSNAYDNLLEAGKPMPDLLERTAELPLDCPPGECFTYQNITFNLLADAAERVTGEGFESLVSSRLFRPLGMDTASTGAEGLMAARSWARPHVGRGPNWQATLPNEAYYRVPAAGGLNGSILDLSKWMIANLGGAPQAATADILRRTQSPVIVTPITGRDRTWVTERLGFAGYGLGWRVYDYAGEPLIFHAGAVDGFRGFVALLPERGAGVGALWNTRSTHGFKIAPTVLDALLGLPTEDWLENDELLIAETLGTRDPARGSP